MSGKGEITVNDKPAADYFADSKYLLTKLQQPFVTLDLVGKFNVSAKVNGGGHEGQMQAVQLGIAKALVLLNEDYKATLKRADLLSRDPRERERKKFGLKGARKQRQFTKR
jgi:small subunit ribosomal protein S9